MAVVAGHPRDLSTRLGDQRLKSDSDLLNIDRLASDRAHLITLGIDLADAHPATDVYQVVDSSIRQRIAADRITIIEVDREARTVAVVYVSGIVVTGFGVGDRFQLDDALSTKIDLNQSETRHQAYGLSSDHTESWEAAGFKTAAQITVNIRDGVTGFIDAWRYRPDGFNKADKQFLLSVAQKWSRTCTPHHCSARVFARQS